MPTPTIDVEVLPPEDHEQRINPFLEELTSWMDTKFEIPGLGWRFGLDAILGLIPGLGDTVTFLVSCYILSTAANMRVPRITLARMGVNVAVDLIVGLIPFAGDLFDMAWKANTRNLALLRRAVEEPPELQRKRERRDWLFVIGMIVLLACLLVGILTVAWFIVSGIFTGLSSMFR